MNELPTWLSAIGVFGQAAMAVATMVLSYVVWRSAIKISRAEYTRSLQDSWIAANVAILQNQCLPRIADEVLGHPFKDSDDNYHTKRYVRFMLLNILEAEHLGSKSGLIDPTYHRQSLKEILDPIIKDSDAMDQLRKGGYETSFVKVCEERHRLLNSIAEPSLVPYSEPAARSPQG